MTFLSFLKGHTKCGGCHGGGPSPTVDELFEAQAKSHCHLFSPQVTDNTTPNEVMRRHFKPHLPPVFSAPHGVTTAPCKDTDLVNKQDEKNNAPHILSAEDQRILAGLFPSTIETPFYLLSAAPASSPSPSSPLKVGVVLSGGQAAGGHNVICGIYDFVKKVHPESVVYGFLGGPHGVYSHEYRELSQETIDHYRNMGGFDMIRSGRHKIETDEQKQQSLEICQKLGLNGLVVIGGDDSNTNAAILAEYFKSKGSSTCVIGCPKTIDGDLKNRFVEISFGFDTACKTYCQAIGNLMKDAMTGGRTYHFVRLMGRSASLITLECAMQTHPNYTFIGEEVLARKQSLHQLVESLANLVQARHDQNKHFGVVLLPEGLIEFIPEVGVLISEINHIVAAGEFDVSKLSKESRAVFEELPEHTRQQLLLDRDPHGNVQVAMIHTEKLLMQMTEAELVKRGFKGSFHAQSHYLGYEGRSGYPSDFDATYCYGLGNVAGALIQNKVTACMAVLKDMSSSPSPADWKAAGVPLTKMMNLETRKGKANVPVIKKFLVDIDRPMFKAFAEVRDSWRLSDCYQVPGPMQLNTPTPVLPFTLTGAPSSSTLKASSATGGFARERAEVEPVVPALLHSSKETVGLHIEQPASSSHPSLANWRSHIGGLFPLLSAEGGDFLGGVCTLRKTDKTKEKPKVGVVLLGGERPGTSNVLYGLVQRVCTHAGGKVVGFKGAKGLLHKDYVTVTEKDAAAGKNQPAFAMLGRTEMDELELGSEQGLRTAAATIKELGLNALVVIGWTYLHTSVLSELLANQNAPARVVSVEASGDCGEFPPHGALKVLKDLCGKNVVIGDSNTKSSCPAVGGKLVALSGCEALGFDTETKVASEMTANLLTDSNSAAKYFYFCQVSGGLEAECEVGLQTHPNVVVSTQKFKNEPFHNVVTFVADAVKQRSGAKKNFGVTVINENFFSLHKELRRLALEIHLHCFSHHSPKPTAGSSSELGTEEFSKIRAALTDGSGALLDTFPVAFQHRLIRAVRMHKFPKAVMRFPTHELLAAMVSAYLKQQKEQGNFSGSFSPVCFEFSASLSASYPSHYDCSLGAALGQFAGLCTISHSLPSHAVHVSVSNPTCSPTQWEPLVMPTAALAAQAHCLALSDTPAGAAQEGGDGPVSYLGVVSTQEGESLFCLSGGCCSDPSKSDTTSVSQLVDEGMQSGKGDWISMEKYCNPGPLQFADPGKNYYYSRTLWETSKGAMKSQVPVGGEGACCRDQ